MGSPIEAQGGRDDAAEWIDWAGGKCPVPDDFDVQILMRIETPENFNPEINPADCYGWSHSGLDNDIIAYRVVPQ